MRLILTVGLPRSGKSTWARQQGHPIVNPDSIRLALTGQRFYEPAESFVWSIAYLMVDALFKAGNDTVIVDATNVSDKRRAPWSRRFPHAEVKCQLFYTSPSVCKERAIADGMTDLLSVIDKMAAEWDWQIPGDWT